MRTVLAVDLAAKYSAACLMTLDGEVVDQFDSWGKAETDFIDQITAPWDGLRDTEPLVMAVEDLPHRLAFAGLVKRVCRLQGRIVDRMDGYGALDSLLFLPPAVWRKSFPGLKQGTGPAAVVPVAREHGYTAPDLTARLLKAGDSTIAKKVATDYCAAFLIATWAATTWAERDTFDVEATSRYDTPLRHPKEQVA